jgi:mevalonate pyrophosphate decarboxylase
MSRPKIERASRLIAGIVAAIGLGSAMAGCSDIYWDRRETIALTGGDSIAANQATQIVDPWPPQSGNKNIAFDGQKMQSAVERYRLDKVTPPADPQNFQSTSQSAQSTTQNSGAASSASATSTPGQ